MNSRGMELDTGVMNETRQLMVADPQQEPEHYHASLI